MTIQVGRLLINLRSDRKYTQQYIADRMCVSRQTYAGWETDAHDITLAKFLLLEEIYEIPVDELIAALRDNSF